MGSPLGPGAVNQWSYGGRYPAAASTRAGGSHPGQRVNLSCRRQQSGLGQGWERGGIPRKAFGYNGVRAGQAQHLLGGGALSPAFSKGKESTAKNLDLGAGEDCLGLDLFYFPLRKPF